MILSLCIAITVVTVTLFLLYACIYQRIASLRTGGYYVLPFARLARPVRTDACFKHLPIHLLILVLLHEDDLFLKHAGVNFPEFMRSLFHMLKTQKLKGGSSITQQTAKSLLFSTTPRIVRKLPELMATFILERLYTKEEILSVYLQVVPTGPGLHGIHNAAKVYFSKLPGELTIAESAVLVSMFPHPSAFCRNLQLHHSDYGKVYDYSYAYEKIVHLLRILGQIHAGDFSNFVQNSIELIKANQIPRSDVAVELTYIAETAKIVHQIPMVLDQIRTRFENRPNAVYYSLTPAQAMILALVFDCPNIPAEEIPSIRSRVSPEQVLAFAAQQKVETLLLSARLDSLEFEQLKAASIVRRKEIHERNHEYQRCFEKLLPRLSDSKVACVLVGGFDLSLRTYADSSLRDPQDTCLMVTDESFEDALAILIKHSFVASEHWKNTLTSLQCRHRPYLSQFNPSQIVCGKINNLTVTLAGIPHQRFHNLVAASQKVEISPEAAYQGLSWQDNIRFIVSRAWGNLRDIADVNQAMNACSSNDLLDLYKTSINQKWNSLFLLGASLATCFGNLVPAGPLMDDVFTFSSRLSRSLPLAHAHIFAGEQAPSSWICTILAQMRLYPAICYRYN